MHINISKVDFGRCYSGGGGEVEEYYGMYVTPAESSAISVTPNNSYYTLHGKYLKYSLNGKKWKDWNGSVTIEPEQKMYLKGEDDYVWNSSTNGKLITSDAYYNVGGDISSLTNEIVDVKDYTFLSLFDSDSYIKDASNLILPATTLARSCYNSMFWKCTSLTTAPELPATTLANSCYNSMFYGCTSLTVAPKLPATTLANSCYRGMFQGCSSLTTAPELPATTLADSCYNSIFSGCTSLTVAPKLPATTLANGCYNSMFQGCTSLTTALELPATTLASYCYYYMFNGCTALTTAPELPATTLADSCYYYMFYGCSKLNNITMLATDISASACLSSWVNGVAPTGTFTKAVSMTSLPTGVNGIPEGWTVVDYGADVGYSSEYMTLSALGNGEITITIPEVIDSTYATSLSYSKDKSNWTETVVDNTAQTITIPVSNGNDVYLKGVAKAWYNNEDGEGACINSSANINVSGNIMSLLYGDNFKDKTTFSNKSKYVFCQLFITNTHLINAENLILPATTLAYGCYYNMFNGCTSLTTAPELPATTLADGCYNSMFYGCGKLNSITMLATDISAWACLNNWVNGVASTGTFTKAASMTSLPTGASGIPSGWTVVDYGADVGYSSEYMTLSALGNGEITITIPEVIDSTYATSLSYSKDKSNWTETVVDDTEQTISIPVTSGENVYLKGVAKAWYNNDDGEGVYIDSSANINASGNIMSLLYGDNFKDKTTFSNGSNYVFELLFVNNTHLINAENLILPATTLADGCYSGMFTQCTSLTTAPELPATTLADSCYSGMFMRCTSLTTAPELPATTLADSCYYNMFSGCTSLTTAPKLPATTLANSCYSFMFKGCTSLTTALELPATTLADSCYYYMFYDCKKLNSITMLATNISASGCLSSWVNGVSSTGTFTKAASMTSLPTGASGIPSGWTVVDYGAA